MKKIILSVFMLGVMVMIVGGVSAIVPSEVWVDDDYDGESCGELTWQYDCFDSIQDAIALIESGGIVNVATGTYEEDVVIDKSLILNGAQVGVDARGRDNSESEIIGVVEVTSDASDVTLDGLKFTSPTRAFNPRGFNLHIESESSTIKNNIFVAEENAGHTPYGNYLDFLEITNAVVEYNDFSGDLDPIQTPNVIGLGITEAGIVTVTNNEMHDVGGGGGIGIMSTNDGAVINIENNEIENTGDGIWVWSPTSTEFDVLTIESNEIYNCAKEGIKFVGTVAGDVVIHYNKILDITGKSLLNDVDGLVVNAINNWWGTSDLGKLEDLISGLVDYEPWTIQGGETILTLPADTETSVDTAGTDSSITLTTDTEQTDATITVQQYSEDPQEGFSADSEGVALGKFINIESDIEDITKVEIGIHYTDEELIASGIDETTLKIYWWDGDSWEFEGSEPKETFRGCHNAVGCYGVDTEENYVWIVTDHFSDYGAGGDADVTDPVITEIIANKQYPTCEDETITISATITDVGIGVDPTSVRIKWKYNDYSEEYSNPMFSSEDLWYGSISLPSEGLGTYDTLNIRYKVYAKDLVGNWDQIPSTFDSEYSYTYDCVDPVASLTGSEALDEGQEGSYDAFGSTDSVTESLLTYEWDWNYDEIAFSASGDTGSTQTHIWTDDGTYFVAVRVTDGAGIPHSDIGILSVVVSNVAPVANAGGSYSGEEGSSVDLTGSMTDDGTLDTHTYAWDLDDDGFYDDTFTQGTSFDCVDDGEYTIGLEVTDDDGDSGTDTATVTCSNAAPTVDSIDTTSPINEEGSTTLTATVLDVGGDDATLYYEINWGDGTENTIGSTNDGSISEDHQYMDDGEYTINLIVTDSDEATGEDTTSIIVDNLNPWNVDAGDDQTDAIGEELCFSGSAEDVVADSLTYSWNLGDEYSALDEQTPCHSYYMDGTYTVTLTVTDEDGGTNLDTLEVTIFSGIIELEEGWNLFSIPLVPEDDDVSIDNVLYEEISFKANKIWSYQDGDWDYNEPYGEGERWSATIGRLKEIVPGYGYYIDMDNSATLYHNGKKYYGADYSSDESPDIPMPPQVLLTTGWNLIGHYGLNPVPKVQEKYDLSGGLLTDLANVNLLDGDGSPTNTLYPGKGYWAFITGQDDLWYAPSEADYNGVD